MVEGDNIDLEDLHPTHPPGEAEVGAGIGVIVVAVGTTDEIGTKTEKIEIEGEITEIGHDVNVTEHALVRQ